MVLLKLHWVVLFTKLVYDAYLTIRALLIPDGPPHPPTEAGIILGEILSIL